MNKTLYVMVGIPCTGKSTIAKQMEKENVIYVSRDEIRNGILKEGEEHFSRENQVYKEFVRQLQSALDSGKSVIADATHINICSRDKLLRMLNTTDCEVTAVHVDCGFGNCLARNSERTIETRVPEGVMIRMYKSFSKPTLEEGFGKIITIDNRWEMKL